MAIINVADPFIEKIIPDSEDRLNNFSNDLDEETRKGTLIKKYPIVYIHNIRKTGEGNKYEVYVGESNNIFQRTQNHYDEMKKEGTWQNHLINNDGSSLYVIAHPNFNKSLTLDIENRLIQYLSSSKSVAKVYNAKSNPQKMYYTSELFPLIFTKVWNKLRSDNKELFLLESEIKESAIFKASPLHKLNKEQEKAKKEIIEKILFNVVSKSDKQFIFVRGDAGTGKTVLLSSIFYEMLNKIKNEVFEEKINKEKLKCAILVNHEEQLTVYNEIVNKLNLKQKGEQVVFLPTTFINMFKEHKKLKEYDVVLVDEAHLLWTRNTMGFYYNNQLDEIRKYARVVVAMFDERQILTTDQYVSKEEVNELIAEARKNDNYIRLKKQMRIVANKNVTNWLKRIYTDCRIKKLSKDRKGYDIKIFDSPRALEKAIREKNNAKEHSLSRMIATYDWQYSAEHKPGKSKYWCVSIKKWSRPWNREIARNEDTKYRRKLKGLAWAEQPQTIREVGSTYTIQGFDLNYAGVILGDSLKYENGKIELHPNPKINKQANKKRKLDDGESIDMGKEYLKNELGVLLTRGVKGLYIYATDPKLRSELKKAIK